MGAKKFLDSKKSKKDLKVIYVRCSDDLDSIVNSETKKSGVSKNQFVVTALEYFIQSLDIDRKK